MIVCFDIGGSAIRGAVATSTRDLRPHFRRPTPGRDFDAFVDALREGIATAGARPARIALSLAGVIDPATGRGIVANIPCLHGRAIVADLEAALGLPVLVGNDADCFALAEATVGAGAGHDVVFGAIIGTGIGGGLVSGGRLVGTGSGYAGEWGHGPVSARLVRAVPEPLPAFACGCGLHGCLDATCSARGIERLHLHLSGESLHSTELLSRVHAGDAAALRSFDVWLEILSGPLAMVVNMTGATVVPVGGGMGGDHKLVAALDAATRPLTLAKSPRPLVVPAQCGSEPGLIGAAILALQDERRDAA